MVDSNVNERPNGRHFEMVGYLVIESNVKCNSIFRRHRLLPSSKFREAEKKQKQRLRNEYFRIIIICIFCFVFRKMLFLAKRVCWINLIGMKTLLPKVDVGYFYTFVCQFYLILLLRMVIKSGANGFVHLFLSKKCAFAWDSKW